MADEIQIKYNIVTKEFKQKDLSYETRHGEEKSLMNFNNHIKILFYNFLIFFTLRHFYTLIKFNLIRIDNKAKSF